MKHRAPPQNAVLPEDLGFFFDEGFAVGRFVGGDDFVRQFSGHVIIVRKLHGVAGAALRHGGEVRGIRKHFRERYHGFDDDVMAACFAALDAPAA